MPQEHERGLGGWQAEWETLPEIFKIAAGALHQMTVVIVGLEINVKRMRANLDQTNGLIMAEAVAMALSAHLGKLEAHQSWNRLATQPSKNRGTFAKFSPKSR